MLVGDLMLKMADIWLGSASMPRRVTRYAKNFPEATPECILLEVELYLIFS